MKKIYSDEMIKTVMEEIRAGLTRAEISEKYAIPIGSLAHIIAKEQKRERKEVEAKIRYCPHCKTKIEKPEMKFCWNCGADIRSEEQLLLKELETLRGILASFPVAHADEGIKICVKIEDYLKGRVEK